MFAAHGGWRFSIEPPIIYIEVIGCFNKEAVESFSKEIAVAVAELPENSVHYAVVDLAQFELATADSLILAKKYFHGVKERGYLRVDYIQPTAVVQNMLENIWQDSGMEVYYHKDKASYLDANPNQGNVIG